MSSPEPASAGKGTGLGFSVFFGIIGEHGGRISALSPPPQEYLPKDVPKSEHYGPRTVFIVTLPGDQGEVMQIKDTGNNAYPL